MKSSYKERARQQREQDIIATAERLIREQGFSNLNMDTLAEQVGISKPTLYQHFSSKDELIAQLFIKSLNRTQEYLLSLPDMAPLDKLEHFIRDMIEHRYGSNSILNAINVDVLFTVVFRNPHVQEVRLLLHDYLRDIVEAGQAQGQITPIIPSETIVHIIFAMTGRFSKLGQPAQQGEMEQIINYTIHFIKYGISNPPNN